MYRGFNLDDLALLFIRVGTDTDEFSEIGHSNHKINGDLIVNALAPFIQNNGAIDGSRVQEQWFPQIKADIFISHSHQDQDAAFKLAGWLFKKFGLVSFIDSSVWGHADVLLRQIDNQYCLNENGQTYSYDKRNGSTSHVHMMLLTALGKMMSHTECLFFLNTAQSITSEDAAQKTKSPWLFAEIALSQIIKKEKPLRVTHLGESYKIASRSSTMSIEHTVDFSHLAKISFNELMDWQNNYFQPNGEHALDVLYRVIKS